MKKIAIIHPQLVEGGGSEARALYIAEALKNEYDITFITTYLSSLERLNMYYGTNLNPRDIKIVEHPFAPFLKRIKYFDAIRGAIFSRFCKTIAHSFDLLISAYNMKDFGKRGIQFIADFSFSDELRRNFTPPKQGLGKSFYNENILRKMYLYLGYFLSSISQEGYKKNLTIANSKWSAGILRKEFGIESKVIYPPVISKYPLVPWEKKRNGFIYTGRLVPEKRIDLIIEVLDAVRKDGFDIHLHIIGPLNNSTYVRYLKKIVKTKRDWIELEGAKYKEEKQKILTEHKYGISAHPNEAFGISAAELVKAGCVVWVPKGGGQVEVVNHQDLLYNDFGDAVSKISTVLKDRKKQKKLRKHLAIQAGKFSVDKFQKGVKELVENFFKYE